MQTERRQAVRNGWRNADSIRAEHSREVAFIESNAAAEAMRNSTAKRAAFKPEVVK